MGYGWKMCSGPTSGHVPIEISPFTPDFMKISIFLKNGKQGVQTVRLDELNNIVTWANISFIFKN